MGTTFNYNIWQTRRTLKCKEDGAVDVEWLDMANQYNIFTATWPCSATGNVSGYRCGYDCRSRCPEFDLAPSHTFVEIDHEIISTVILLPSAESFKKG